MKKLLRYLYCLIVVAWIVPAGRSAGQEPISGLYQIVSGSFQICCGNSGTTNVSLPNAEQHYLRLDADDTNRIRMTVFGDDGQTVFRKEPCTVDAYVFNFDFGLMVSNRIVLHAGPSLPPNFHYYDYRVDFAADQLEINGVGGAAEPVCSGTPARYTYDRVLAVLIPPVSVRPSEASVCWPAILTQTYQLQFRSSLDSAKWTDLGLLIAGNGGTNCVTHVIPPGDPKRFYRVVLSP